MQIAQKGITKIMNDQIKIYNNKNKIVIIP